MQISPSEIEEMMTRHAEREALHEHRIREMYEAHEAVVRKLRDEVARLQAVIESHSEPVATETTNAEP